MKRSPRFTIIEFLIVVVILGLLATALLPNVVGSQARADHFACQKNLQNIYALRLEYKEKRGHYPLESGVRFLLAPWTDKVCERDVQVRDYFFCPAVRGNDPHYVENIVNAPVESQWPHIETVTSADSNYAGRRQGEPGVPFQFEGDGNHECLAADDNERGSNHKDRNVNALFGSGSVRTIRFSKLELEGVLESDDQWIPVGPGSPIAELRQLTKD